MQQPRRRPYRGPLWLQATASAALLATASAGAARACAIDGIASMTVDGYLAAPVHGSPTAATLGHWAPFALGSASPGQRVQLSEDLAKLRRTIPADALRRPFDWRFGDGNSRRGTSVTHTYARAGWYRVTVRFDWASRHRWVQFDSASLLVQSPPVYRATVAGNARTIWLAGAAGASVLCLAALTRQFARWRSIAEPHEGEERRTDGEQPGE